MDLSQLNNIKSMQGTISEYSSKRHQESEEKLFRGLACLEFALEDNFKNKDVLREACSCLIDAMVLNRADTRPCLSLGYLFLIIGDTTTSKEYLQLVLEHEPDHPVAHALLESITEIIVAAKAQPAKPDTKTPTASVVTPVQTQIDYDDLYEQVEMFIFSQIKFLSTQVQPKPSLIKTELTELETTVSKIEKDHQRILEQLGVIEEEIDCTQLRQDLRSIELTLQRYQEAVYYSVTFRVLKKKLEGELDLVNQVTEEAKTTTDPEDLKILDENFEVLLENCDNFANQIETFEAQHFDVKALAKLYENLASDIEKFQEHLDDAMARLELVEV